MAANRADGASLERKSRCMLGFLRDSIKWALYPGIDFHARLRCHVLDRQITAAGRPGARVVLDAGCGNGFACWAAYKKGNRAIGISVIPDEVRRNTRFFNMFLGIPREWMRFECLDVWQIDRLATEFDEIVCSEVLTYIVQDDGLCARFRDHLVPGGVLHLCSANAAHLFHQRQAALKRTVRAGYSEDSYRSLLEPIGFKVETVLQLGGPVRQWCNQVRRLAEHTLGRAAAVGVFVMLYPLVYFEPRFPQTGFSVYVRAVKAA